MRRLLAVLAVSLAPAVAQTPDADSAALEAARAKVAELQDATAEGDVEWREAYTERVTLLEELVQSQDARAALPNPTELEARRVTVSGSIQELKDAGAPTEVVLASVDEYEGFVQSVSVAEAAVLKARGALDTLDSTRAQAEAELGGLAARGDLARARSESANGSEDDLGLYVLESAQLEVRVVGERATFLTEALEVWTLERAVLELEVELAQLDSTRAKKLLGLATTSAEAMREDEADETRQEAEAEARRAEQERDPIERFRLQARADAGQLNAQSKAFGTTLERLRARLAEQRAGIESLSNERVALEQRLALRPTGGDDVLRRRRDRIRRVQRSIEERVLPELDSAFGENQSAKADTLDLVWDLRLPHQENEILRDLLDEVEPARHDEARAAFDLSLEEDGWLEALKASSSELDEASALYTRILAAVDERAGVLAEYEEFVQGRMIWTRSDTPVDGSTILSAASELAALPRAIVTRAASSKFGQRLARRVPVLILALAVVIGLHFLTRKCSDWRKSGLGSDPWARQASRSIAGLAWVASPPLQLWTIAWALRAIGGSGAFSSALAELFWWQATFVLARRTTRWVLEVGGLLSSATGDRHVRDQIVRSVRIFTVAGQALYAPSVVLAGAPFAFENLTRIIYPFWIFFAAVSFLQLIRREGALVQNWTRPGSAMRSALGFLFVLWWPTLIFIVALDLIGYRVGAERTLWNELVVLTGLISTAFLLRGIDRLGTRSIDRLPEATTDQDKRDRAARVRATDALTRIASVAIVVVAVLALHELWGAGDPFRALAESWKLIEVEPDKWLTARDFQKALWWVIVGHLVALNLRRLHEFLVAPFTSGATDEGSRYSVLALIRYAVIGLAYFAALISVGFSFQTIGWFATAVSVGVGFGLQEIVANFVSGVILLFERPLRVGDIVTIGSTSGSVDSISMRATTITNWERQTIIVPNKKFVTENFTNWTRHDRVMRREFDIRVAYGSDIEKVLRVLEEVVKAHSDVLEDPAPIIWYERSGLVGMEFRVLFYASIDVGLSTRSAVQSAAIARLAHEGIEVPSLERAEDALVDSFDSSAPGGVAP